MGIFNTQENRIRCGRCNTEFDLNKNKDGCPLCGFNRYNLPQKEEAINKIATSQNKEDKIENESNNLTKRWMGIPPLQNLNSGTVLTDEEKKTWGSWLMVNDLFSIKFFARFLAWNMHESKSVYLNFYSCVDSSIRLMYQNNLGEFKGFPANIKEENLQKDGAARRFVYHFIKTGINMGLMQVRVIKESTKDIWNEDWRNIEITLTKEGLEFARLKNEVFDDKNENQVLTSEESEWFINYLRKIEKSGYREYSTLKEVVTFLKKGKDSKDLIIWFENNPLYKEYVSKRTKRGKDDKEYLRAQLHNYAQSFASSKISLLRELGIVKNKRNDYTIIGELK